MRQVWHESSDDPSSAITSSNLSNARRLTAHCIEVHWGLGRWCSISQRESWARAKKKAGTTSWLPSGAMRILITRIYNFCLEVSPGSLQLRISSKREAIFYAKVGWDTFQVSPCDPPGLQQEAAEWPPTFVISAWLCTKFLIWMVADLINCLLSVWTRAI